MLRSAEMLDIPARCFELMIGTREYCLEECAALPDVSGFYLRRWLCHAMCSSIEICTSNCRMAAMTSSNCIGIRESLADFISAAILSSAVRTSG